MEDQAISPREVIVPLDRPHVDARGAIIPLLEQQIRSALIITSHPGAVRGNHYHKTDWHYCYVLSGSIDYRYRPAGTNAPPTQLRIEAGQLFFTPPMVEHAMVFTEETVFLTLGRNPRDQTSYEGDVVRVSLIDAG